MRYNQDYVYISKRAMEEATKMLGYPCPCGNCNKDNGRSKSIEICDLAANLMGFELNPENLPLEEHGVYLEDYSI